jgi:hypothetical protein
MLDHLDLTGVPGPIHTPRGLRTYAFGEDDKDSCEFMRRAVLPEHY